MEPRLSLRGIAWECMAYRAIEIRRTTASNCVAMRGTAASNCTEMRRTAARKCVEMRGTAACMGMWVAWTLPNRSSSARDTSGKRTGSAAQVRLKHVEPRFHALVGPVFIRDRHVKGWFYTTFHKSGKYHALPPFILRPLISQNQL